MQIVVTKILIGAVALVWVASAQAEDRIQAFVDSKGNVLFTNMIDENPVAPPPNLQPQATQQPKPAGSTILAPIQSLVNSISAHYGVDPELVVAMMKTESNFNRWAVSSKGALGLMQLIPETGRRYGVRDFFDPRQNIEGGVRYLKFLLDKFKGNIELSLAAYNAGENLVQRLGRVPPIPETQDYVRKIRLIYRRDSPVTTLTAVVPDEPPREAASAGDLPAAPIFTNVDARGVIHFSNIGPAN